jgi:hypothetical protein
LCYFLYIASPLTLSEVRSMLPAGVAADLVSGEGHHALKSVLPRAQTVACLLIGRCSCDLVRLRLSDSREDERHLRDRYRKSGLSRELMIKALERHRRGAEFPAPPSGWSRVLADFVAEHARNAGPTLYHLEFSPDRSRPPIAGGQVRQVSLSEVRSNPDGWLQEDSPALVYR